MAQKTFKQRSLEAVQKALDSVNGEVTLDDFYSMTIDQGGVTLQGDYKAKIVASLRQLVNNLSTNDNGFLVGGYYLTLPVEENEEGQLSVYVRIVLT